MIEHVETHLDTCGKHLLVFAFALMQLACIFTYGTYFYSFWFQDCNPLVYNLSDPFKAAPFKETGLEVNYTFLLSVNLVLAAVFKFGSIICLRLALEEYQNLNANSSYFVYAMFMCMAPGRSFICHATGLPPPCGPSF